MVVQDQHVYISKFAAIVQRDATTLEVTELPIRKWTQDYKEFLETLIKPEDKNAPALIEVLTCLLAPFLRNLRPSSGIMQSLLRCGP